MLCSSGGGCSPVRTSQMRSHMQEYGLVSMSAVGCIGPEEGQCKVSRQGGCRQGARLGVGSLPGAALGLRHVLERLALGGLVLLALAVVPVAPARSVPSAVTNW